MNWNRRSFLSTRHSATLWPLHSPHHSRRTACLPAGRLESRGVRRVSRNTPDGPSRSSTRAPLPTGKVPPGHEELDQRLSVRFRHRCQLQIKVVAALHGPANLLRFFRRHVGEVSARTVRSAPTTPRRASPAKRGTSLSPQDRQHLHRPQRSQLCSSGLDHRGAATTRHAASELPQCHRGSCPRHDRAGIADCRHPEKSFTDLQARTPFPGVALIVQRWYAEISLLQSEGHFTYVSA